MSICGFLSIFLKNVHMKHDLLAHWSYFCRCVEDRPQRDPIFGSVWAPNRSKFNWCNGWCRMLHSLPTNAHLGMCCICEMGHVLYMFRLWNSPWPVPNVDYFTVSPPVQLLTQPHIGIVEWGASTDLVYRVPIIGPSWNLHQTFILWNACCSFH